MEVYIELAFLQNLAIDGALLYATQSFLGYRISMRRILFAALVGAAFAIVYPLMSYPIAVGWVIKLFSGATICLIASAETFYSWRLPRYSGLWNPIPALPRHDDAGGADRRKQEQMRRKEREKC